MSLSARRAWIEIFKSVHSDNCYRVALRKESVDRNVPGPSGLHFHLVALRKESVDRNVLLANGGVPSSVALRKESVDRN